MRSQFVVFGINSSIIVNVLLTVVLYCYTTKEDEYVGSVDQATKSLEERFACLKDYFNEKKNQNEKTKILSELLYVRYWKLLVRELIAPLHVNSVLKKLETKNCLFIKERECLLTI